ncbi:MULTISPECIES: hypothetical protein [unclassified Mesorhizobium]|nr:MULTISPECIES: hypothetical protein [unclassified Mesorhizobium]TGQ03165.1 hypothetical protein EN860_036015 [Mesorhizobium sp. M00.F.Ca.ET.217.01.1.1]TGS45198.1 hypothetical protein EN825_15640 [Mesorhizobium sp. M8A.F.Ca.ET.182.01.1.1]TGS80898.1 hypothetical protein EN824_15875 [Mesorhizobium sp. M8A.F.Ca.ET.181.01.1.1]
MSEQEKFLARLGDARNDGLVDVKFFFHPSRAVKPEEIFAGLNGVEDAIRDKRATVHTNWDNNEIAGAI